MQDVHSIEAGSDLRLVIGPVNRRGKDFVASALLCGGREGILVLEMGLEQRGGETWPHLETPPIGYATKGRDADLHRIEARLERLFTERLVAASTAARATPPAPPGQHCPQMAAPASAASFFLP